MECDTAVDMPVSHIRYGVNVTREVGAELSDSGAKNVLVVTDKRLAALPPLAAVRDSLDREDLTYSVFDGVRIEPTDESFREAIRFAEDGGFDAFVAVGGGSSIDTAKAAVLYSTYPADDFLDYVNPPIGGGMPPPGELPPLIAIPTTAGTGSEVTSVAVMDIVSMRVKTGISHRLLKPKLGLVDPENTRTLPKEVAASTGLDVLCHAAEAYTTIEYNKRPRPERPSKRPPYQGANPISDIWSLEALRLMARNILRVVADPDDDEARGQMMLASSYAGLGFGNAGCHWPHAMSYPVSGMVRNYYPAGWPSDHPIVPHGLSVVLNAPAAFRFTGSACPQRHLRAAEALGAKTRGVNPADAGALLADTVVGLMQKLGTPSGLAEIGFTCEDIPELVKGTLAQERITKLSPLPATEDDIARMFADAMKYW